MKKKKLKQINLPMKFNPALQKYEPELPLSNDISKNVNDIIN